MTEKSIGENIRRFRENLGLTLTELAIRASMTKGALSKIETGRGSAAIATIMRIAEALGVPIAELFADSEETVPYVLTRNGEGKILTRDGSRFGYSYEAVALGMKRKVAEPFLMTIQPSDPQGEFHHKGQEFIYMLSGQMEFTVGDNRMRLSHGDSLYFDSSLTHHTRVLGNRPAKFLCLIIQENNQPTSASSSPSRNRRKS